MDNLYPRWENEVSEAKAVVPPELVDFTSSSHGCSVSRRLSGFDRWNQLAKQSRNGVMKNLPK
jgi:hypothetical protein